ncbi:histidine kinase [Actinoplanes sp. NPDC049802]|uniref:sensor histidine kinase n=1 Tax=Actinoplanes sp. NPDC049802 TaxID=3154742 RepID=UPI0033D286DD
MIALAAMMACPLLADPLDAGLPVWITPLSLLAVVVAVALHRSRPSAVALGMLAAGAVDWRLFVAVAILSYLAGRREPVGAATLAGLAGTLAFGTAVPLLRGPNLYGWLVWMAGVIVLGLFPALVGSFRRLRTELVRAGWDRAAQLEREQRIVAEQARLRERARIAQDMHDSLGHELSLVALRAGALELDGALAPEHRKAASEVRAGVTTAADRLSEIIGLLRDEEGPAGPAGERIEELVERAARSGVPVVLESAGTRAVSSEDGGSSEDGAGWRAASSPAAPGDLAASTPGAGDLAGVAAMRYRAAYRVVQEALTNATKHAPAAPVRVSIDRDGDELIVTVRNEPPSRPPAGPVPHGGRGLTGLRERVGLAGGVLRAGPLPDGGFQVVARLPVRPGPVLDDDPEPTPPAAGFRTVRRRARRGLALALTLPTLLAVALAGTLMAVYAHDNRTSHLPPAEFRALTVGADRGEIGGRLPERQAPEHRDENGPPPPPGSACEYYRSAAGFVPAPFDVYRLCFRDGRLVAKDVLPPAR